jgi:CTP:molybdopterin cytidylyltransferase MocA
VGARVVDVGDEGGWGVDVDTWDDVKAAQEAAQSRSSGEA